MEKVNEVRELLGLTADQAILVLRYYKWNFDKLQNEWFENERKLKKKIGLEFDPEVARQFPYVNASLKNVNQGYC